MVAESQRRGGRTVADPGAWETTTYVYDPAGRRIAKAFDGDVAVRYLYDGDHCIAEYDGNDVLLRKFVSGPGVDQPICMTEVQDANAVYYYHFDGLGSVVALSDADGDTVQVYEYSVYGQAAASDPNHPNPFLFTARRFDSETGLYHYRARMYNPYIGRFLQTDSAQQGMNLYRYCSNDPVNFVDPSGLVAVAFYDGSDPGGISPVGPLIDGAGFKHMAEASGCDYVFDMMDSARLLYDTVGDYIIAKLEQLKEKDVKITEIYFFDHGWNGELAELDPNSGWITTEISEGGFTLGNEVYTVDGRGYAGSDALSNYLKRCKRC